ncbi:MAG: radical SAM protein [Desulfosoma sp.]
MTNTLNGRSQVMVRSCPKLESGLRLGQEGIHACQLGPFSSPIFWTAEEAGRLHITREMIIEKRQWLFELLNDPNSTTPCKHCHMVTTKRLQDVRFDRLGHIDLAAETICNLRCSFCGYTKSNSFARAKYEALNILHLFEPHDVLWNAAVDFNGGEPTLLHNFDDYLDYFRSRRIRVFLYTNGTIYSQSVFDGLVSGMIRWVCISLDAGTPGTYRKIKKADRFQEVLENIARYSSAGALGGGQVAVKYIFSENNCGEDDICGFAYAMLALRPQEVWLTFDFEPIAGIPGDQENFGGYDYSRHISAYAKSYVMLAKHGLKPVHFPEKHLATVSMQGKLFLKACKNQIAALEASRSNGPQKDILLEDFRRLPSGQPGTRPSVQDFAVFRPHPPRFRFEGESWKLLSLEQKRIAFAPASVMTEKLISAPDIQQARLVCIFDRDPFLHGKKIAGLPILPYEHLKQCDIDHIVICAADHNRQDIVDSVSAYITKETAIYVIDPSYCEAANETQR